MKQTTLSLWLGGVLLVLTSAAAQAAALSLEQTLDLAQRYSAELSASRNQVRAFGAMADSARQLPDPELKFGIENLPVQGSNARRFTREGMTMQRVGVMQTFVSADKRERKADTLLAQSASASAQEQVVRAQLQRDTAQAWLDLALSEKAAQAARQLLNETGRQIPVQRSGVASGSAAASSTLALQSALSAMRDNLTLAERDVSLAQTRLYQLTGETFDGVAGALPRYQRLPAEPQTLEQGVSVHPEVVLAAREADVAKARSAQSAVASKPDVGVEVYYARRAEAYGDLAGVMFTVGMPIFQSHRQDKDYAADVSVRWKPTIGSRRPLATGWRWSAAWWRNTRPHKPYGAASSRKLCRSVNNGCRSLLPNTVPGRLRWMRYLTPGVACWTRNLAQSTLKKRWRNAGPPSVI